MQLEVPVQQDIVVGMDFQSIACVLALLVIGKKAKLFNAFKLPVGFLIELQ
jgi:hypothetical protein